MIEKQKFLNPYNFVRYLIPENGTDLGIMGRCYPPPHDRFLGLSGKIECKLENFTPLFISDSEDIQIIKKEHYSYRFFKLMDEKGVYKHAIPSTSLRGVFRSVFEAVTNSCFSVFEGGMLGKRQNPGAYKGRPKAGLITKIPSDPRDYGIIEEMKYLKLPHFKFRQFQNKEGKNSNIIFVDIVNNEVVDVKENTKHAPPKYKKGYLKTSSKGLPGRMSKRNEYIFIHNPNKRTYKFSYKMYEDYISANRNNSFDHTKELKKDNALWFRTDRSQQKLVEFGFTQIYRKIFKSSIKDLLPRYFLPCDEYKKLCPACRTFGWVHPEPPDDIKIKTAYSGRVKISHGKIINEANILPQCPFPLANLASPKPTTTYFYLLNSDGQPEFNVKYINESLLRGRKFFRHGESSEKEYIRAGEGEKTRDKFNRTIREALSPNNQFKFFVEFNNLTNVELGALLWSLELEDQMYHKIGLAKPLGFGSIKISIENLKILDCLKRYSSITESGWNLIKGERIEQLKEVYKNKMENIFGVQFNDLCFIKDLKGILSKSPRNFPIHYPRTQSDPIPEGKNFEWFQSNEKIQIPLDLASDDKGLPILDPPKKRR